MTPEMKNAIEKGRWREGTHHETFFKEGFEGVVIVRSVELFDSKKFGDVLLVTFEIEETNSNLHPKGSLSRWIRPLCLKGPSALYVKGSRTPQRVKRRLSPIALGEVLVWMAACGGYGRDQTEEIDREVRPAANELLDEAVRSPTDNAFVGLRVRLRTELIETKSGKLFTRYDFSPWSLGT